MTTAGRKCTPEENVSEIWSSKRNYLERCKQNCSHENAQNAQKIPGDLQQRPATTALKPL